MYSYWANIPEFSLRGSKYKLVTIYNDHVYVCLFVLT